MDESKNDGLSRRDFLAWAAAAAAMLALPGCDPAVPQASSSPRRPRPVYDTAYASPAEAQVRYVYVQQQPIQAAPRSVSVPRGRLSAMSRNSWGATAAIPAKMKAMNGVARITVHHEGSAKPNNDTAPAHVAATLRLIQSQHRKRMGAGDIGYHFIIDRTGTIWQGRDWNFQGAHTSGANSNNLGIMLLGNFEIQQPTAQQIASLKMLTGSLVRKYRLNSQKDIYSHNDFCNTQCPGKALKPHVLAMRRGG